MRGMSSRSKLSAWLSLPTFTVITCGFASRSVLFLDPKYFQSILNQGGMRALVLLSCGLHEDVQLICARAMVRIALDKELLMEVQDDSPVCGILLLCDSKSAGSLWVA